MMSRNIRQKQKFPPAPVRKVQRRRRASDSSSSSLDLSGDDGYSGVDDVSDSEDDDEEDVDAAEEEHIITDELHPTHSLVSPRPLQEDDEDADEEVDDEEDEDEDEDDDDDEHGEDNAADSSSWNGIVSEVEDSPASSQSNHVDDALYFLEAPAVERHVRFAGVPDSDSDSTTSEVSDHAGDFFPDIFVEQTSLDPAFRRELEQDPDDSSASGSFWDFQEAYEAAYNSPGITRNVPLDDDTPTATPTTSRVVSEVSTPVAEVEEFQELDGYETDGDTTEEDVPDPLPVRRKLPRRAPSEESDSDTDKPTSIKSGGRDKPRVGRFHLNNAGTKPIAVVNPRTRKMMIFTPRQMRGLDLSPETFNFNPDLFRTPAPQSSPILSNSGTVMLGAMFASNTFGDFINTQPIGPTEAFFPNLSPGGVLSSDSEYSEMEATEEDEAEKNLKLEDFITFDPDDDSGEEGEIDRATTADWDDETNDGAASTPRRRPSTAMSTTSDASQDVHPLLAHFDGNSDAVGAFRRNQVNQQLILSDKATKESLLFSNSYSLGTLRGVRSDSLNNVAAPLTPVRRRKRSITAGGIFDNIDSSPLASVSQKRKASAAISEAHFHKRHRSISDVQALQI